MSNEKREAQKKNRELAIRKAQAAKSIKWIIISVILLLIVAGVVWAAASSLVLTTKSVENVSEGIGENGFIEGVRALDYVDLCDYKNITVPRSEVEATDEEVEEQINMLLNTYPSYSEDTSVVIKDGDTINLDYVGSVDGVEFEGGSTGGNGTSLVIGSGSYIPGFEDQIIGHKVGENFDIFVTFPEQYHSEDLAGKDAVFNITINSVKITPVFDDAFVKEHLSDVASTKDEYIEFYKKETSDIKMNAFLVNYLRDHSAVKSYPKKYLNTLKGVMKHSDELAYEQNKAIYGDSYTFEDYIAMSKKEYEASLSTKAMEALDDNLKMQAICEDGNLTVTLEDVNALLDMYGLDSSLYSSYESKYGKPYLFQTGMTYTAIQYVKTFVTITD